MTKEGREGGDSLTPRIETQVPLKPCPFCGGAARLREWPPHRKFKWGVDCLSCGAENKDFVGAPEAIAAWNARESAPVGEASAHPDLVEGIARAIAVRLAKLDWGEAYEGFESSQWLKAQPLARDALDHISSLGMVVVPREPTPEMLEAGASDASLWEVGDPPYWGAGGLYKAMIEAAPMHTALSPRDERAVTGDGWQPIETAPRDREIMLWARGGIHIGHWDDDRQSAKPAPYWNYSLIWRKTGCRAIPPTHWQPLPTASKDRGEAP